MRYIVIAYNMNNVIGAHFIQTLVERFDKHHEVLLKANNSNNKDKNVLDDNTGKECTNLIVLLTELYNFQVSY